MKKRLLALGLMAVAGLSLMGGCSANHSVTGSGFGRVSIRLIDSPGNYDQVNLVVDAVSIHRAGPDSTSGWESLPHDSTTTYDLLELQNGVFAMLGVGDVPAGHYTQIRLHLSAGSNVVVNGVTFPLKVPSGMQSGYKLVGEFDVPAGGQVELTLDFDAARSVHQTGNGQYMLKPTCRVIVNPVATAGAIIGHLLPEGVTATVYAVAGTDTVQTTTPTANGHFTLAQLLAGTYAVQIHPESVYRDTTLLNVAVSAGQTTDVGDVQLDSLATVTVTRATSSVARRR